MALAAYDVHFHYSGAAGLLGAQPDPDASLGGWIASSSNRLYHTQTNVLVVTNDFHISSFGFFGQDYTGDWILAITGPATGLAAKIIAHDSGTGNVWLSHPMTGIAAGNSIRVHSPNNLFDDTTAAEAQDGEDEYRGIYVRNETGITLTAVRAYLSPLFAGDAEIAIAFGNAINNNMGSIVNEDTDPDVPTTLNDLNARFESIFDYTIAYPGIPSTFSTNNQKPMWIRRTIPALSGQQDDIVWAVCMTGSNPIDSAALIVFGGAGFNIALTVQEDRYVHIGGGVRVEATLLSESGLPLEDYSIEWALTGDGSIDAATGDTDEDGKYNMAYTAPTDQGKVGDSITITAKVL